MNAFYWALIGAVCWGIAPLFGKVGLRGVNPIDGLVARTAVTLVFVFGLLISRGSFRALSMIPGRRWLYLALEAFLATFAGDLAYYAALKKGAIGQVGLIMSAAPLVTVWAGWYFLNETLSPVQITGAVLIIAGLVLVSFK